MNPHRPVASLLGGPRGIEVYTRVSLYCFVLMEGFLYFYVVGALVEHEELPPAGGLAALAVAALFHMVACFCVVHVGFDGPLTSRGRPHPATVVLLAAALLVVVLAMVVLPGAGSDAVAGDRGVPPDARGVMIGTCGAATFGALAVGVRFRRLATWALVVPVLVAVPAALDGTSTSRIVFLAVVLYLLTLFWAGTVRLSMWIVEVVRELEESRAVAGRLAVAEERLRISRDMHDVVGRALSAVAVKSELSAALARRGDPRAADEMDEVRTLAHESLREVRGVVAGYRSADLATELAGARSVLRAAGIAVRVVGDVPALDAPRQEALAWVVREAVTNVVRHSDASECRLDLDLDRSTDAPAVVLRIVNDGVVRGTAPTTDGHGLAGLRERLVAVDGTLDAASDGDLFTVVARVPTTGATP